MYAVLDAREDIIASPIVDDYLCGKNWNLFCQRDQISCVATFLEWFLTALEDDLTKQTVVQLCGCRFPHDPNHYPRIEYAKQYSPDHSNHLQTVYGCALQDFMKEHRIPEEGPPETTNPPDFTRPPRETFRPLHHLKMNTVTLSRPSWASAVYEKSFDTQEPKNNQFTPKRFNCSYANVAAKNPKTTAPTHDKQQSIQTPQKNKSNTNTSTSSLPTTTTTSPPSEPSTLTPPSEPIPKSSTIVSPNASADATENNPEYHSKFVKQTEQRFLDISRKLMELNKTKQNTILVGLNYSRNRMLKS